MKKDTEQQAKVDGDYAAKLEAANAAGDAIGKLKAWCSKPPYDDLGVDVKVSFPAILETMLIVLYL